LFTVEEEEEEEEKKEEKEKGGGEEEEEQQQRTSFSNGMVENIVARQLRNHGSIPDIVRDFSLLASIQTG
jgi:hypothetical protein